MFEPKEYTVKFIDWDGTLLFATSVTYGNGVETADIPTEREGWHFTGWDENPTYITDDTDFHAQYEPDTFDVTVAAENGSVVSTDIDGEAIGLRDVPYGTIIFLQALPIEDYMFLKWENGDERDLRILTVTKDLDLTATFTMDPDGIEPVNSSESMVPSEESVYNLAGQQMVNGKSSNGKWPKGINIIRMSDGTTRKVIRR